uniref:DNA-directed RNA polymerase n=1 Tax=Stauridium tetras TaxID=271398 RepID=A0A2U8GML4_9CHLO|nr:alpha subunit of RNA polymerase [Stauridium tetras]AWI68970.1 alpha subunit of RNA polymerase [Stauridium tetras]
MSNLFLTCKECILESPTKFYGCFYLGPFNSSQSLTVANGLRRTLLSEIPTLVIQSVEIEGVEHEFSTYPGIRESILDLLLNFKEIVLTFSNNEIPFKQGNKKPFYGFLQARGPGIIRASDLKLPSSVISVDPNQYIATLTTDGILNVRFTICEGVTNMQNLKKEYQKSKNIIEKDFSWFVNNEKSKKDEHSSLLLSKSEEVKQNSKNNISLNLEDQSLSNKKKFKRSKILWLDPIYSPILKVNYIIESCESLELNPINQVILLELWTNGSIHPRQAVYAALSKLNFVFSKLEQMKILNNIFANSILNSDKFYSKVMKKIKYDYNFYKSENLKKFKKNILSNSKKLHNGSIFLEKEKKQNLMNKNIKDQNNSYLENFSIESLGLPYRIKNSLTNANILCISDLLKCQIEDLKKVPGISNQSLILLIKRLNEKGFKLKR